MKLSSAIPLVWCVFSLVHYFTDAPHDLKINPPSSDQPCDYPSLTVLNNASYSFPLKPFEAQESSKKPDAAPIPGYQVEEVPHVWITSIYALGTECPLGGWGNPPFEDCDTDDVLVNYAWIDYQGRVLTHEEGHWLGLHHLGAPPGSLSSSCTTIMEFLILLNRSPT